MLKSYLMTLVRPDPFENEFSMQFGKYGLQPRLLEKVFPFLFCSLGSRTKRIGIA